MRAFIKKTVLQRIRRQILHPQVSVVGLCYDSIAASLFCVQPTVSCEHERLEEVLDEGCVEVCCSRAFLVHAVCANDVMQQNGGVIGPKTILSDTLRLHNHSNLSRMIFVYLFVILEYEIMFVCRYRHGHEYYSEGYFRIYSLVLGFILKFHFIIMLNPIGKRGEVLKISFFD